MASAGCGWQEADRFAAARVDLKPAALLALKDHPASVLDFDPTT
jgi:hypothetical protein